MRRFAIASPSGWPRAATTPHTPNDMSRSPLTAALLATLIFTAGCLEKDPPTDTRDTGVDVAEDAGAEVSPDASEDARRDASTDGPTDATDVRDTGAALHRKG